MKLIHMIKLNTIKITLEQLAMSFPEFTLVQSDGYLKIYKQVR